MSDKFKGKHSKIKLNLIEAAGALFAEHGLEGTGIRAIVKKAGTALSAVNYHFQSKEQLYADCIGYVIDEQIDLESIFRDAFHSESAAQSTLDDKIYKFVTNIFNAFLAPETKPWYGLLLMRSRLELHPKSRSVLVEVTVPEKVQQILLSGIPGISYKEAWLWVIMLISQLEHYVTAKETVLLTFDLTEYTPGFILSLADFTAKSMITILDTYKERSHQ